MALRLAWLGRFSSQCLLKMEQHTDLTEGAEDALVQSLHHRRAHCCLRE